MIRKTRVTQPATDPDRWVAQYFDPVTQLWCDIGKVQDTQKLARADQMDFLFPADAEKRP